MGKQNELGQAAANDGLAFIEAASPLTRLHYFDGKFLRADAFALEQDYHRQRSRLGNLAGGWGIVHGLGIGLAGNQLQVGAGLGITPAGNFVLATSAIEAALAELIAVAAPAPLTGNAAFGPCGSNPAPGFTETTGRHLYEITVGPVEGLCGNEAVYGKLCESACASSSQHPYWREGVVLRLRPITLALPDSSAVSLSDVHLRNRVASAYFAAEPALANSLLSAAGLAGGSWCQPAGLHGRDELVLGLLVREGGVNRVIDAWAGRRERMDTQARGYWQGRMAMRPWNVFLAQILQFQCQLSGLFDGTGGILPPPDECASLRQLLDQTRQELEALHRRYGDSARGILQQLAERPTKRDAQLIADQVRLSHGELFELADRLAGAGLGKAALPRQRMLLNAGFVELPPAGYLPVVAGSNTLDDQLSRQFGEGVRLHYHGVRSDEIAHLLEEAQHMHRISLTRGLDDPRQIEEVEIFVPEGQPYGRQAAAVGEWWRLEMALEAMSAFDLGLEVGKSAELQRADAAAAPTTASTGAAARSLNQRMDTSQAALLEIMQTLRERMLQGLIRTHTDNGSGYGFTLVCALDLDDLRQRLTQLSHANPDLAANDSLQRFITAANTYTLYLAGDIGTDPFELGYGDSTPVSAELRLAATVIRLEGSLTALFDRPAGHVSERVMQLELLALSGDNTPVSQRGRIALRRDSSGRSGRLVLDDERADPASSPVYFEWHEQPRTAAMSVERNNEKDNTSTRSQLMDMRGLDGMPGLGTPIGASAMNALIALADQGDDAAFLARARRRLFPTLDTVPATGVRAVLDWVMFRRARSPLCCTPQLAPTTGIGVEAFQVWHLRLDNRDLVATLRDALDRADPTALARFPFQRVGILRYRDENTVAEESAATVLAMWQQAAPGPQVVLGRHWEAAPATGQGWQNHFRLRHMLSQISALTQTPARGDGSITALSTVVPPLSDGALDGGLLVVTLAGAPPATRRALLVYGNWDRPNHYLERSSPNTTFDFVGNQPQGDTVSRFIGGLTPNQPVAGLTLATPRAAPDSDAPARLQHIIDALVASGRPAPVPSRRTVEALNDHDRKELDKLQVDANDFDDIVFLELNAGA